MDLSSILRTALEADDRPFYDLIARELTIGKSQLLVTVVTFVIDDAVMSRMAMASSPRSLRNIDPDDVAYVFDVEVIGRTGVRLGLSRMQLRCARSLQWPTRHVLCAPLPRCDESMLTASAADSRTCGRSTHGW
jgi:hypothetical protein